MGGTFSSHTVTACKKPDALKSNFAWAKPVVPNARTNNPAKIKPINFFISFPPQLVSLFVNCVL
jgi:hypothetical protein